MKPAVAIAVIFLVAAMSGFAGDLSGVTEGGNETLRMEELEVHGIREKQEVLYLPVHRGVALPSPVRYDLFLEDMERPVFHREILPGATPDGGPFAPGSAP